MSGWQCGSAQLAKGQTPTNSPGKGFPMQGRGRLGGGGPGRELGGSALQGRRDINSEDTWGRSLQFLSLGPLAEDRGTLDAEGRWLREPSESSTLNLRILGKGCGPGRRTCCQLSLCSEVIEGPSLISICKFHWQLYFSMQIPLPGWGRLWPAVPHTPSTSWENFLSFVPQNCARERPLHFT